MITACDERALFRQLLGSVPAEIAIFDRNMRYIACSDSYAAEYGISASGVVGLSHYEVFPEIGDEWRQFHRLALAGEEISRELDRFPRADGTVDWVSWRLTPWRGADGEIGGIILNSQVMTGNVEDRLRSKWQESELNLLIDSALDHAIYMLDPEGRVTIWNRGAERVYGWPEASALGKAFDFLFGEKERAEGVPGLQLAKSGRTGVFRSRSRRQRSTGEIFAVEQTLTSIRDDSGALIGFGEVVRDVSLEITREQRLERAAAHLQSILDTVPDAMIVIDEHGVVEAFSAAAERLFGYAREDVIGRNVSMLMPSPDRELHATYIARYLETGERRIMGTQRRIHGQRKDGSLFPSTLSIGEARANGRRVFTGFLHDLTTSEAADLRLEGLRTELAHFSRISALGTMASALAHELNQPLMAVANYVQAGSALLEEGSADSVARTVEALKEAGREALRAGTIVHHLREFASSGETSRTLERPFEIAQDSCALASAAAKARGIDCVVEVAEAAMPVLVDRVQIQQVLINLMRNAFDALERHGEVRVSAGLEGDMTRFSVTDNGPGVPASCINALFEPFSTRKREGMGLGLSICRAIVEAHGGQIWYDPPATGAAFHFTVPTVRSEESADA